MDDRWSFGGESKFTSRWPGVSAIGRYHQDLPSIELNRDHADIASQLKTDLAGHRHCY